MNRCILKLILFQMVLIGAVNLCIAQNSTAAQPDNTKTNQRDRNNAASTADKQKDNASDRQLTQDIRKAVVDDKSLSTYGHNVKIVTENGMVTLKGPVRSEEEKQAIEAKAKEVAGANKVHNELEVAPKK